MKHILVTGGAGFLGSHLCDLLLAEGCKVTVADNLFTGSMDNIVHNLDNPNFSFINWDIMNPLSIDEHIDGIFHLASPASPMDYIEHSIETLKAGSIGTHNVLELAREHNATFLISSTSEVYGDPMVHPQKESYWGNVNPIGPRSVYDESKRYAEAATMAYHNTYGLDTRIVRIFNTYGPRMRLHDGRVVPELIHLALTGKPLTIFGDGSQTRSFCYVSNEVEGINCLFKSDYSDPVNIGDPVEITVLEFAAIIKRLTNSSSEIVFRPLPKDDPTRRRPDISRAKEILDWEPKISLEEGLKKTIDYFKEKVICHEKCHSSSIR